MQKKMKDKIPEISREKQKLLFRIKRIRGQFAAVERALEAGDECADVLMLLAAIRGGVNGLMAEILEDHIRLHMMKDTWFAVSVIGLLCVCKPVFFGEPFSWRRLAGASAFVGMGDLTRLNAGAVFITLAAGAAMVVYCLRRRPE